MQQSYRYCVPSYATPLSVTPGNDHKTESSLVLYSGWLLASLFLVVAIQYDACWTEHPREGRVVSRLNWLLQILARYASRFGQKTRGRIPSRNRKNLGAYSSRM